MQFELLDTAKHHRKNFDCGVEVLNLYLQRSANQDRKRSVTKVYVLADGERVIGYYTISAHAVLRKNLPESYKLPPYEEMPFLLLGRLAVDKEYQGQGYGDALIFHAFSLTIDAAEKIGILGMIVDAKDDNAASFYEGFGFHRLEGTSQRLMIPLSAMKQLLT